MLKKRFTLGITIGFIAAIFWLAYILVVQQFDANPLGQGKYMMYTGGYALFFVGGMYYYRSKMNQNQMRGQEGIGLGIIINATTALLVGVALLVYFQFTEAGGELLATHRADLLQLLELSKEQVAENMGEETLKEVRNNIQNLKPRDIAGDLSIGIMMAGLFHTFLFMLIFKTKLQ